MNKLIFISSYDENKKTGINKKIYNQYRSLKKVFTEQKIFLTTLERKNKTKEIGIYKNEDKHIFTKKLDFFLNRWKVIDIFVQKKNVNVLYIRYEHFASKSFIDFLKKNKEKKIFLEIPTYPYDKEYKPSFKISYIIYLIDKIYRKQLYKYVDHIVTFSQDEKIWKISCINISNGINLEDIKLIQKKKKEKNLIEFTSVSSCDFWHGLDRFILSLNQYEHVRNKKKIIFNIVGEGPETLRLKELVAQNKYLQEIVRFKGFKSGSDLDDIYNQTDIAVGCLGNHRKGIYTIQALKNKEYMAKGLPMIFSEDDPGLRNKKFVYKATHDEQLINIEDLINWYENLEISPKEIRSHAEEFTWDIQMKKVIDNIYKSGGIKK